jgi:predicted deacylase
MKNFSLLFGFLIIAPFTTAFQAQAQDLQFNRYHTQDEINQFMRDEATKYPSLVKFKILGKSEQGREISYVIIGKHASAPALYYNGTHHGDEWSSTESILGLIDYLLNHQSDSTVSALLSSYNFYIQPLVNPDGHAAQDRMDPEGRDPNRDYAWAGRSEQDSFKIPVIVLVKQLMDQIKPRAAAAYHSGIEEVLWSWCYTDQATPDADLLTEITKTTATAMGFDRYMQSYFDYETDGEFIDYAYMKYHTTALTFEVSEIKTPPASDLAGIVQNSIRGALAFATAIQNVDLGLVKPHANAYEQARSTWKHSTAAVRLE